MKQLKIRCINCIFAMAAAFFVVSGAISYGSSEEVRGNDHFGPSLSNGDGAKCSLNYLPISVNEGWRNE